MSRDKFFDLFRAMLDVSVRLTTKKGSKLKSYGNILGENFSKRQSNYGLGKKGEEGGRRSMSENEFNEYVHVLESLSVDRSHWSDLGLTKSRKVFDKNNTKDEIALLKNAFIEMKQEKSPRYTSDLTVKSAIDRIVRRNSERSQPFATSENGTFKDTDEIIAFLKETMGGDRAAGRHIDALGIGQAFLCGILTPRNPWGLKQNDIFQITAAVCALGHWTAHQAGPVYRRERIRYFEHGIKRFGDDPFFKKYELIAQSYDDPNSDAPYKRLKIYGNGMKSKVISYSTGLAVDHYQAADLAMLQGTHPEDASNVHLCGLAPKDLMMKAIEENIKKDEPGVEDAVTELQSLAQGYSRFGDFTKAIGLVGQAENLIAGSQDALMYRRRGLYKAKSKIYHDIYRISQSQADLDKMHEALQIVESIEKLMQVK